MEKVRIYITKSRYYFYIKNYYSIKIINTRMPIITLAIKCLRQASDKKYQTRDRRVKNKSSNKSNIDAIRG